MHQTVTESDELVWQTDKDGKQVPQMKRDKCSDVDWVETQKAVLQRMMLERLEWDRTYKGSNPRDNLLLSDYRREKAAEMAKEAELELEAVRAEVVVGKETISAQVMQLADLSDALEKGAEEESRLYTKLDAKYAELDEVTQKENLAEGLIEYFRNTSANEREHEYFEKMLDLTYENQNLKSENIALKRENQTLKAKLQQAYNFMKQFTIGGVNMLEKFLRRIGVWVQQKVLELEGDF